MEDQAVVNRLATDRIPLTVCPLSNNSLRVFDTMEEHSVKQMIDAGLNVTINSDDPPYFGGYSAENILAVQRAFGLSRQDITQLARNSFEASFLSESEQQGYLDEVDAFAKS
jgi:adenosine deaminase